MPEGLAALRQQLDQIKKRLEELQGLGPQEPWQMTPEAEKCVDARVVLIEPSGQNFILCNR
jgi:hypothetical protein